MTHRAVMRQKDSAMSGGFGVGRLLCRDGQKPDEKAEQNQRS